MIEFSDQLGQDNWYQTLDIKVLDDLNPHYKSLKSWYLMLDTNYLGLIGH